MVNRELGIQPDGKIVDDYKKVLQVDEEYNAYTINKDCEIVKCKGLISNNGAWNYHNNYDTSEDELYVKFMGSNHKKEQWWTLSEKEALEKQKEVIAFEKEKLNKKVAKLENREGVVLGGW